MELPYYNNTSYPLAVKEQLSSIPYTEDDKAKLMYHQFIVKEFFTQNIHQRGLLICHSMGLGKTRLAVSIADHYKEFDKKRKIIVLLPKSLEGNFKDNIKQYTNNSDEDINKNYSFVSLNSINMFKKISNIKKSVLEEEYEKKLGVFLDSLSQDALNNSLLIIDEAHNLFNAITNGSNNATRLYDLIISSSNLKLIFLTGTPIINDPFELIPCFNMLRGTMITKGGAIGDARGDEAIGDARDNGAIGDARDNGAIGDARGDEAIGDARGDTRGDARGDANNLFVIGMSGLLLLDNEHDETVGGGKNNKAGCLGGCECGCPDLNCKCSHTPGKCLCGFVKSQITGGGEHSHDNKLYDNKLHDNSQNSNKPKNSKTQRGNSSNRSKQKITKDLLFSESIDEFYDYFVDFGNKTIKNKDKFINRIFGMSSYYGDLYFKENSEMVGFPKKLPVIVEEVHMSEEQFARYSSARFQELDETKKKSFFKQARFSSNKGNNSTYRVKSRQISNYCIPEYALGPIIGKKSRVKFIDKITHDDLINLKRFSPKMQKIIFNIKKFDKSPGIVYSQFVSGEGLAIFSKILNLYGYENYFETSSNPYDIEEKPTKKYAIISGEITPEERIKLIGVYNNINNTQGEIIHLLLLSGAVSEGIDLKRVRHVHIMEPFWNYARINQVETRAIRYLSHADLPPDQQNVQTFIYLSIYPEHDIHKKLPKGEINLEATEKTTDKDLYEKSIYNMQIIKTFIKTIAESSIDCNIHFKNLPEEVKKNINCLLCAPTDEQLYHPILSRDLLLPNTCKPYKEKKITATEIIYEPTGEKFYYIYNANAEEDSLKIYSYNKKLKGYTPIPDKHPYRGAITKKIMDALSF